jgi:cyclic pyranopterin phosphate synthase
MPKEVFGRGFQFLRREQVLTFEEITRLARIFVANGVEKIRLTGGEPLLRRHLDDLVAMLRPIDGLRDLTLTTNGSLLAEQAAGLKRAGLDRVTVSLDSLDDEVFRRMNDVDFPVQDVLDGIDAAEAAGLGPIKINMVVQRGVNEHTVVDFARYFKGSGHIVRFIEYMDVGTTNGWRMQDVVPGREIVDMINREMPLVAAGANYRGEVAERWRYVDGTGEIGIITSVTQPFCHDCTRSRLSAEGQLYTCLFASVGTDFRGPMRSGQSDEEISALLRSVWRIRDDRYSEVRTSVTAPVQKVEMSRIGG